MNVARVYILQMTVNVVLTLLNECWEITDTEVISSYRVCGNFHTRVNNSLAPWWVYSYFSETFYNKTAVKIV